MDKKIKLQYILKTSLVQAYATFNKANTSKHKIPYLRESINQINEYWKEFQQHHRYINSADSTSLKEDFAAMMEKYNADKLYEEFEETYFEFLSDLQENLEKKTEVIPKFTPNDPVQQQSSPKFNINLPRIDLPKFSGDYKQWRSFYDMFTSLIHTDDRIPNVQKLHYLKSCLSGEAERIIKQFDMIESNYSAAWSTLNERFNNKRVLVTSQLKELFNQPTIKSESKRAIKELLDKTKECIHELNAMEVSTKDWDPIIIHLLIQRLPHETHKLWEQEISKLGELPSAEDLYEFLESRFRTLEAMSNSNTQNLFTTIKKVNNYHINEKITCVVCNKNHSLKNCKSFERLNPISKRDILKANKICVSCLKKHKFGSCQINISCALCKESHTLSKCKKFKDLSINDKKKAIGTHNLCYNCLRKHPNIACPSDLSCFKCSKRHHTLLHEERNTGNNQESSTKEVMTACHYNKNQTQTLLATSIVSIKTSEGFSAKFRALIDLGSQSSYITEAAFQSLHLIGDRANLQIAGLGSTRLTTAKKKASFTLQSNTTNFEMQMEAYVIKNITNVSPPTYLQMIELPFIQKLQLADPEYNQPGNIDLLLGANIYSKIISNGIIQENNGMITAQNTKLGWILFGEVPSAPWNESSNLTTFIGNTPSKEALNGQMKEFWECEELERLTQEEKECGKFYNKKKKQAISECLITCIRKQTKPTGFSTFISKRKTTGNNLDHHTLMAILKHHQQPTKDQQRSPIHLKEKLYDLTTVHGTPFMISYSDLQQIPYQAIQNQRRHRYTVFLQDGGKVRLKIANRKLHWFNFVKKN